MNAIVPYQQPDDETLRVIRYFLPRLDQADLSHELTEAIKAIEKESRDRLQEARQRHSDLRSDIEMRYMREIRETSRWRFLYFLLIPVLLIGVLLLILAANKRERLETQMRRELDAKLEEESTRLAEIKNESDTKRHTLETKLDALLDAYASSIATDDEVNTYIEHRIELARQSVLPSLGLSEDEILDERSVEHAIPTFLAVEQIPPEARDDIVRTAELFRSHRDSIVEPMVKILGSDSLTKSFLDRVYARLGLGDQPVAERVGVLRSRLNVWYNSARGELVSYHWILQRFVCAPDFVGVFRGFVNVFQPGMPYRAATQLFYQEVVATRVESHTSRTDFLWPRLSVEKRTKSLVLATTDGYQYRLSSDDGSVVISNIDPDEHDETGERGAFGDQVESIRSLIRDTRRHLLHMTEKPVP